MKKLTLVALALVPLAAFAQGRGPGPGAGRGPDHDHAAMGGDPERVEKRMRLTRTLGLAEALDLDAAQALKLGEAVAKFDERRLAAHKQLHDAHLVLRNAARGEKASAAEVDQALQKAQDARAQVQAIDRDVLATVTKDLSPEKKARAALFLERFQGRFGPGGGRGMMMNGPGRGMGRGMGMRMGPGAMDVCPDCPMHDDHEQ